MSIEYSNSLRDNSSEFKTQRTEQSEFDYNNVPVVLNAIGNVNYSHIPQSNIPQHDDTKIVLNTSASESLNIKVTPSDGKKTVVQIIKRDDNSILESNTIHVGAVVKNSDELPDNFQGDGKFLLYKQMINRDKPFRRSFSPTNSASHQTSLDDYQIQLIKQSSSRSKDSNSNCGCCLIPSTNDQPSYNSIVNVTNQPFPSTPKLEKLSASQSIINDSNFKIFYEKPYSISEFVEPNIINKVEQDSAKGSGNAFVKCVKSVIDEAAKALQCFFCGELFNTCEPKLINPFTTCNICYKRKDTNLKPVEVCPSCRSDNSFANKIVPTLSNHYEVFGPNIYRYCNSNSESSILSSDYQTVPFKQNDSLNSEYLSYPNDQSHIHKFRSVNNGSNNVNSMIDPSSFVSTCTCSLKSPDQNLTNISLADNIENLPRLSSSPINSISPFQYQPNSAHYSPISSPNSANSSQFYTAMNSQKSISPSTSRTVLPTVDPQLIRASLKSGNHNQGKKHQNTALSVQKTKFDYSQHISFDKIAKYSHVILTIDNISNLERVNRVLITSGNFVLNYKDLALKGLRVPVLNLNQSIINVVFEISPPATTSTRLLAHCGFAPEKKFYYVDLPLDFTNPMDSYGIIPLLLHGSKDNNNNNNNLDDPNLPRITYKIRKYVHGSYCLTCLPSFQPKFQYVSLYSDTLDEFIGSIVKNMPFELCTNISKESLVPLSDSYVINGVPCKIKFAGDIFVYSDQFQGKLTNYLQQLIVELDNVLCDSVLSLQLFDLPDFTNFLENTFLEWTNFVMPGKDILSHVELKHMLRAHATAMVEELLIRLIEYLGGPIIQPSFGKYLVPPMIYYNEELLDVHQTANKALFTYLWHVGTGKDVVGNMRIVCKSEPIAVKNKYKIDAEDAPQVALVELVNIYNTTDGFKVVNNIIEKEVQRILELKHGYNDFIASVESEIKHLI